MSIRQKCAWGQLAIFGGLLIGWLVLFISRGTIFYWQDDSVMITFYILSGAAFALLAIMNLWVSIKRNRREMAVDERDRSIYHKASLWATAISYTTVAALLLAVAIIYMNQGEDAIPVYFPLFIVLIGGVTLLLTQAITALLLYRRKVSHGES
jgi:cadmium resistance protein CadD (predicted permease)